jgi:hypothetical protein
MPRRDAAPVVLPDSLRKAAAEAMLSYETCPLAARPHSADSHDGRDDGVDFPGRSLANPKLTELAAKYR